MNQRAAWLSLGVLLVAGGTQPVVAEIKVQPDKDNVVSSRLAGSWEAEADLTKRLEGRAAVKITFTSDETVATKVPEKFETFLGSKTIYMAGMMTFQEPQVRPGGGVTAPFLLIEHKGNPHLVFFLAKDGDAFANPESWNVMLAVAKNTANDLLFVGGDFNNQPFAAYRRAKAEAP